MNRTTISNRLNNLDLSKMRIANPSQRTPLLRQLIVLAVMLFAGTAWGQQYVFMYDNHYLANTNNDATIDNANTFDPNTCIWSGTSGSTFSNNGWYLQHYQTDAYFTLRNSTNGAWTNLTITNDNRLYRAEYGNYAARYLRYNNGWTGDRNNTTGGRCQVVYAVTITNVAATITNPTISGADELTATGTSDYSASGAAYRAGGYTNYYFNSTDHYFDADGNSFTPANATLGSPTWSLSSNGYATVNALTGTITVNSLPENDIELTLTITYPVTGGNPAVASGTTFTASKTITLQGTIPAAPIITVSGTTVTLSTDAAGTTTIRYTLDGTDPTTTTGTAYSGSAIDISGQTTSPVVIKAITVRSGNASSVTEQSVQLTLPEPVITANASAGTATISSSTAGTTIYYTTDGTTPTSSSTQYTGPLSGLSLMTTIKAIAVKDGWNNSPAASATLTLPSGVSGTTVTLFDLEDHKWSYYSDPDCPIRSLNPADVKITYYGNGQTENNMTTTDTKDIPTSFGAKATGVRVSATEAENTFVYYKTLERTNGEGAASKAAANGAAMYTTIPNPFQVRPTGQNNGNQSITLATRRVYLEYNTAVDYGGYTNGTVTCQYYDINNNSQTLTFSSSGNTYIEAKVGTQITVTATSGRFTYSGRNYYNRATITALYNNNSGTQIATATSANNNTNTTTQTSSNLASSTVTVSAGTYRGFYAWRVKSKSASITSITDADGNAFANNIIPAETDIRINTTSEYGNEIEFEALWAQAYATTGSTDLPYAVSSSVPSAYERNFHILNTSTAASDFQKTYPCTVIGREPNSTTLNTTRAVTGGFTAAAATKFEELNINNATGSTWSAAGHDLIIGRGCTGTVNNLRGAGSDGMDYMLRIESGTYDNLHTLNTHTPYSNTYSGTNKIRTVLGSDYDRAKGDNNKLTITSNMWMGEACYFSDASNSTDGYFKCWVKSGNLLNGTLTNGTGGSQSFYLGTSGNQNTSMYIMPRYLYMEGGILGGVAGGLDDQYYTTASEFRVLVRMTGGYIRGCLYGAGSYARGAGIRKYVLTGGEIGGWVAAGCNGIGSNTTEANNGEMNGDSYVYIGGDAAIGYKGTTINDVEGGNVFGAGRGAPVTDYNVGTVNNSNIVIADDGRIEKNVYGGGNYGFTINTATISILGGTVDGRVFGGANMTQGETSDIYMNDGLVKSGIFGGCNTQGNMSGNATIQVDGGTVGEGNAGNGIFGGGYGSGTSISGNVSVTLGTCNAGDATVYGDVYGGSALGSVNASSSNTTTVSLYNGTIYGGIYGGGYGPGGVAANVNGAVEVKVFGGSVLCSTSDPEGVAGSGSVFGCNNAGGAPQSTVKVDIYKTDQPASGYALHAVYGGGNKAAYNNTPVVTIHGCSNSIEYVYGGGNATDVLGTNVTIWGGTIGSAFGGGNGAGAGNPGANITAEGTNLVIHGGTIGSVFGGSNERGKISSSVNVTISGAREPGEDPCTHTAYTECPMEINEMYSGGNKAELRDMGGNWIAPGNINVSTDCSTKINYLFGGARMANYGGGDITLTVNGGVYKQIFGGNNLYGNINGNVTVNFLGGKAEDIFGGNNMGGTVLGTITVNIDSTANTCTPDFYVENVYGGGNEAPYSHAAGNYPEVNVKNGTVQQDVYGGGLGAGATVTGSPKVTVGVSDTGKKALVLGNVFGGGNAAAVAGSTEVNISYDSYIKHNVYGGGNAAPVSGDTKVNVGN